MVGGGVDGGQGDPDWAQEHNRYGGRLQSRDLSQDKKDQSVRRSERMVRQAAVARFSLSQSTSILVPFRC